MANNTRQTDIRSFIPGISVSENGQFFLLAGPCVVESRELALTIARHLKAVTVKLGIPFVFKASYRKANRSRADSFAGIGDHAALEILAEVRREMGIPVITDIHSAEEATVAADYVDVLQIPALPADRHSPGCGGDREDRFCEEGPVPVARSNEVCGRKSAWIGQ